MKDDIVTKTSNKKLSYTKDELNDLNRIDEGYLGDSVFFKYYDYILEKVKDPNYLVNTAGNAAINFLLDIKRYDLLKNIKYINSIEKDLMERILNEFPFDDYNISNVIDMFEPEDFYEYLKQIKNDVSRLEKLSFGILVYILNNVIVDNQEDIKKIILDKIEKRVKNLEILNFGFYELKKFFSDKEYIKILKVFLETKNLSLFFSDEDSIFDENIINEVCNIINSGYKLKPYESINNMSLLKSDKFVECIIEKGCIQYIVKSPLFSKYIDLILRNITDRKNEYINNIKISGNKYDSINHDFLITIELEMMNYTFENKVDINPLYTSFDMRRRLIERVVNLPIDKFFLYLSNCEYSIKINCFNGNEFYYYLLSLKNFEKISVCLPFLSLVNNYIQNEYKNLIIEQISNNHKLADSYIGVALKEIVGDVELRHIYINMGDSYIEKICNYIFHHENLEYLYNDDLFNQLKGYFIKKYNLNSEHLEILKDKFGLTIIKYCDSPQIQKITNLDSKCFHKFIELFPQEEFELKDLEAYYDSFKQVQFAYENPEIINIFTNILHSICDGDDLYLSLIEDLKTVWSLQLVKKISNFYPVETDSDKFFDDLINGLKSKNVDDLEICKSILNIITSHYIAIKREEYRKTYNMFDDLHLKYNYDQKEMNREISKYLLIHSDVFLEKVVDRMLELKVDRELINLCITYYVDKELLRGCENLVDVQKNIKYLVDSNEFVLRDFRNLNQEVFIDAYNYVECNSNIKKKFFLSDSSFDIYKMFCHLRMDLVEKFLLSDLYSDDYKVLKMIIKKYKLDKIPNEISENLIKNDLFNMECEIEDLSSFINYFHKIIELKPRSVNYSPIFIFKMINTFSSLSSVYSQILGKEDYQLIKADPSPNNCHGSLTSEERLKAAVKKTIDNYNVTLVNVPSFIEIITLNSGKKIKAIVANFTRGSNLTHGERTGSCMRIGGVGDSLFYSKDIFHIEFRDLETDKYLSRVTCFRNGNTIFQNELRCSCLSDLYSDEEIVEADKIISNLIIEKSKGSSFPIDNVVVHRAYALESVIDDRVNLNIVDCKEGLSSFYTDVGSFVHVIATSSDDKFEKVVLGNDSVPKYKPVRDEVKCGYTDDVIIQINRVNSILAIFEGYDYEYLEPLATEIIYGIVGEDWYVYIDTHNKIVSKVMNRDSRSQFEYECALEEIQNYMEKEVMRHAI